MNSHSTRFGGINRLYGTAGAQALAGKRVAIVGIGGVGSWVAEALARTGVGQLILMDLDDVCQTNINRQIHALTSTIGTNKTHAMAERIMQINPDCTVTQLEQFYTPATADALFYLSPHIIIDAIDTLVHKAHLIAHCYKHKLPIITCGGAGGRTNAQQITMADLSKTHNDALLAGLRKRLKQEYGLPLGEKSRKLRIPCVFSPEPVSYPSSSGAITCHRDSADPTHVGRMACDAGLGSATHITATFGMMMAGECIRLLLHSPSPPSTKQRTQTQVHHAL